jgi:hypothetical protein
MLDQCQPLHQVSHRKQEHPHQSHQDRQAQSHHQMGKISQFLM